MGWATFFRRVDDGEKDTEAVDGRGSTDGVEWVIREAWMGESESARAALT